MSINYGEQLGDRKFIKEKNLATDTSFIKKKKSWQQTSIGVCMSHGVGLWKGIRTGWESFYNLFRFRLGNI